MAFRVAWSSAPAPVTATFKFGRMTLHLAMVSRNIVPEWRSITIFTFRFVSMREYGRTDQPETGLAGELQPEQHEYKGIVLRNVKQLQSMINDLLEVTRVQAGKLMIEPQRTSISDAIAYAVDTLQGAATAKRIALSSDMALLLPSICTDPTRLRQILIILVDNAIKFTSANGEVKIQARVSDKDFKSSRSGGLRLGMRHQLRHDRANF